MATKYTNIFNSKALQNTYRYPHWDFWFEKISSGNSGTGLRTLSWWSRYTDKRAQFSFVVMLITLCTSWDENNDNTSQTKIVYDLHIQLDVRTYACTGMAIGVYLYQLKLIRNFRHRLMLIFYFKHQCANGRHIADVKYCGWWNISGIFRA
jgi:hypothetical protein